MKLIYDVGNDTLSLIFGVDDGVAIREEIDGIFFEVNEQEKVLRIDVTAASKRVDLSRIDTQNLPLVGH